MFSRFIVRALNLYPPVACSKTLFWADGVMLFHREGRILLRCLVAQRRIEIFVRCATQVHADQMYCSLMDAVNLLIKEWTHVGVTHYIACYNCMGKKRVR